MLCTLKFAHTYTPIGRVLHTNHICQPPLANRVAATGTKGCNFSHTVAGCAPRFLDALPQLLP